MGYCILSECKSMTLWDTLAWKRPKVTGALLGSLLAVLAFYCLMEYTLVTFLCRLAQLSLLAGLALGLTNRVHITSDDITQAVDRVVEVAAPHTVQLLTAAYQLLTWKDYQTSAMVAAGSVVVAFLGNHMSDAALLTLAVTVAFTAPAIYEQKRDVIDAWVHKAREAAEKYVGALRTKVDAVAKKDN